MYRIMEVAAEREGEKSLYRYITTKKNHKTVPLEAETKEELDEIVERMLNDNGYAKSSFIIVKVVDYFIDACDYTDDDDDTGDTGDTGNPDDENPDDDDDGGDTGGEDNPDDDEPDDGGDEPDNPDDEGGDSPDDNPDEGGDNPDNDDPDNDNPDDDNPDGNEGGEGSDPDDDGDGNDGGEDDDSFKVSTVDELNEALSDPDIKDITLTADMNYMGKRGIDLSDGSTKTIDLAGYNVIISDTDADDIVVAVYVHGGSTLNLYDSVGTSVVMCETDGYNIAVDAAGDSTVNIYGGKYVCNECESSVGSITIYGELGDVNIYNGYYENESYTKTTSRDTVLNIKNNSGSYITCYGGQFVEQDPYDGDDTDTTTGKTFLARNHIVTENTLDDGRTLYTVSQAITSNSVDDDKILLDDDVPLVSNDSNNDDSNNNDNDYKVGNEWTD